VLLDGANLCCFSDWVNDQLIMTVDGAVLNTSEDDSPDSFDLK
jgi:hypothetical protein